MNIPSMIYNSCKLQPLIILMFNIKLKNKFSKYILLRQTSCVLTRALAIRRFIVFAVIAELACRWCRLEEFESHCFHRRWLSRHSKPLSERTRRSGQSRRGGDENVGRLGAGESSKVVSAWQSLYSKWTTADVSVSYGLVVMPIVANDEYRWKTGAGRRTHAPFYRQHTPP